MAGPKSVGAEREVQMTEDVKELADNLESSEAAQAPTAESAGESSAEAPPSE